MNVRRRMAELALAMSAVALAGLATPACGGKTPEAKGPGEAEAPLDADPLALLPGSAVAVATVDARALYDSGSLGGQLAQLTEQLVPIGQEAGFVASRDVDRVTVATYSTQGADVAAVLRGRFDATKLEHAARSGTATRAGAPVVSSSYAGRTVYTLNNVGFSVLTERTVLAGTETGIRRALDRLNAGKPRRDFAPWVVQTLETQGAAFALTADLANQPVASAAVGAIPMPWLTGLRAARLVGTFEPAGVAVAGSLTYGDAQQAARGADGVRSLGQIVNMVALTGVAPKVQGLKATVAQTDVQLQFTLDDQSLRSSLGALPKVLR